MTFNLREVFGGRPRWLYTFARSNQVWRLSGAGAPVTVAATGISYAPAFITHDRIQQNADVGAESVTVRVAITTPIADALREVSTHPMSLRIEKHQPQDAENVPIVRAFGDIAHVRLVKGMLEFDLVTGEATFGQAFPTKKVERQCQWASFSAESGLDERQFSYATTLVAINDRVYDGHSGVLPAAIVVDSIGLAYNGYYNAGQLKFGSGPSAERVFIDHHVGPVITLAGKLPRWVVDAVRAFDEDGGPPVPVTLIAGDDKMFTTWRDRFGAVGVDRFLGFDLLPATDPMQTGVDRTPLQRTPYVGGTVSGTEGGTTPTLPFRLYPEAAQTDTDGTVTIRVADPEERITAVDLRSNATGFAGDWSAWSAADVLALDSVTGAPSIYAATAAKGAGGLVEIEVRVGYLDGVGAPQTQTALWVLSAPFYDDGVVTPDIDDASVLIAFWMGAGANDFRAFLELAADQRLLVRIEWSNQTCRLFVNAPGGPFDLLLADTWFDGTPITNTVDGVVTNTIAVNGYRVFDVRKIGTGHDIDWTTVV